MLSDAQKPMEHLDQVKEHIATYGASRTGALESLGVLIGSMEKALKLPGSLESIANMSVAELIELGLTKRQALTVATAFGLAIKMKQQRFIQDKCIRTSNDVASLVADATRGADQESFWVLTLNARHRVKTMSVISIGTLNSAPVHLRDIFSRAVRERAQAIILAHNHPSDDLTPSMEDRRVTERAREAGELLNIQVLDHIVVGRHRYFSFADNRTSEIKP